MAGKLQRCYRCLPGVGREFEADRPECPECGAAGPPFVVTLTPVHWLVEVKGGPIRGMFTTYAVACQPQRRDLTGLHCTESPAAVTCPKCKQHETFEGVHAAYREENE